MQRFFLFLIIAGLVWMIGFAAFISRLPTPETNRANNADAVVVFTGGGGARIIAGMSIFADGAGERLLISGVHEGTSRARISEMWSGDAARYDCCVDLGRAAQSTQGNAAEAGDWVRGHDFTSIILVTSEFHMPRAIVESRASMPGINIQPHAVASELLNEKGRPRSGDAWRRLASEYSKYLAAHVKAFASGIGS